MFKANPLISNTETKKIKHGVYPSMKRLGYEKI